MKADDYYFCPTHGIRWVARYLHEHGALPRHSRCQREKCVLERMTTNPADTFDLGAKR